MNERERLRHLTGREIQTFDLVAHDKTTREISKALGVSVHTVKYHRRRVYEKLDVRSAAGLVRYAALAGWFSRAPDDAPIARSATRRAAGTGFSSRSSPATTT